MSVFEESREKDKIYSSGIGHTRWATHGGVTLENTHPHHDTEKKHFVVHNGIIENYRELKKELEEQGVKFYGQTDTEVIAKLLEKTSGDTLLDRVENMLPRLDGAYAFLVIHEDHPDELVAVKYGSPLIFGSSSNGDFFFSSDASALSKHAKNAVYLEDGDLVHVEGGKYTIRREGALVSRPLEKVDPAKLGVNRGSYKHFMLKEIHEIPKCLTEVFRGRVNFVDRTLVSSAFQDLRDKSFDHIEFIACGTSYHAGLLASYWIEELTDMQTKVTIASEFFSKPVRVDEKTLYIFISQSGETADSIEPLKYLKEHQAHTFGIVNVVGSSIARMTDMGLFTRAGTEVGVASTKAFVGQIGALLLLSLYFSIHKGSDYRIYRNILDELEQLPLLAQEVLDLSPKIRKIASDFIAFPHAFFLSR